MEPAAKIRKKAAELGHIERLVLENFKSYAGRQEIGPFEKFSCIIGPNGSGKSNVMDAISFCLGIRAKQMRAEKLRDLVYRREEEDVASNTRSAKVTIVFRTGKGDYLHFGRYINARGEGTYRYGAPESVRGVSYDEFLERLAEQSIFVKARNFLVFQGDVMEMSRRTQDKELTSTLETISGSEQLQQRYASCSRELEQVQERARLCFQKRREIEGQMGDLEKQKEQVLRFQELRKKREKYVLQTVLFKLMVLDREAERDREGSEGLHRDLARGDSDLKARKKALDEKEALWKKLEMDLERQQAKNEEVHVTLEALRQTGRGSKREVAHWQDRLKERELQLQQEALKHGQLEEALAKTRDALLAAEAAAEKLRLRKFKGCLNLTSEQRAAFEDAEARTDAQNAQTREREREAEALVANGKRELAQQQRELAELEASGARGAEKIEEMRGQRRILEMEVQEEVITVQQRAREAAAAAEEARKFAVMEGNLREEARKQRKALEGAKARRERLESIEARQRVAEELRGAFPGDVLGRISEVLLATQRRFELPLQMALGAFSEAFVVRDAAAARKCVRYLKEKKIATEVFVPLDRAAPPSVGAIHMLVQGQRGRHRAVHCVNFNEKFLDRQTLWQAEGPAALERAVAFLLNNTIIVDNLDEAKQTAYYDAPGYGLTPRVVTLDGEVISPDGNMSVQCVSSAGRVEFGGAEQLHEIRAQEERLLQTERDLETLCSEALKKREKEEEAKGASAELASRHEERAAKLKCLEATSKAEEKLFADRAKRGEALRASIEKAQSSILAAEKEKEELEKELMRLSKRFFAKLNKELNVENVREVMRREQREKIRLRQDIDRKEDEVRVLKSEERRQFQLLKASRLHGLREDVESMRTRIAAALEKETTHGERQTEMETRYESGKEKLKNIHRRRDELEEDLKSRRTEVSRLRLSVEDLRRKTRKQSERVRGLLNARCAVFRDCNERGLKVPLLESDEAALELVLSREGDLDQVPFPDLEASSRRLRVNFSLLPQARKDEAARCSLADSKAVEADFAKDVAAIDKELMELRPNMKAPEELEVQEEKLREVRKQEKDASFENQRLGQDFEKLRAERLRRFMQCFRHVEAKVQVFYKELTAYDGHEGGNAYLDLEDAEEPFNGGVTFTACPPGKRFMPMEQLSGGEKAMASMALLFAMHSYQPPPFMILDEVDAPFDRKNTSSLVSYLKELHFQCIVISLKDSCFCHADSLVGIYKDTSVEVQSSGSLSLALKQLATGPEEGSERTPVPLADVIDDVT